MNFDLTPLIWINFDLTPLICGNDTTIAGGNLAAADIDMAIGGDLTVASVQNTSQVTGGRWDVSGHVTVGAGVSGGASAGYGETEGSSAWVNEQSSIIGSNSVTIRTEGHTQIDGALIANLDEHGNDQGNLTLDTGSLAYSDIKDHDQEKSYYLNVGFTQGNNTNTNQQESGANYSASGHYSNHDKEQINRATVGEGTITVRDNPGQDLSDLNRDSQIAQEVTKDDSKAITLYASTTALDSLGNLVENPEQQLGQWKDNVANVGSVDAWGIVAENVTDVGEDIVTTYSTLNKKEVLGLSSFLDGLDANHKMTQLKNELMRTAEGQALLEQLQSEDPDEHLAAQAAIGQLAQSKFGIDPSDILFYSETETDSTSLQSTLLADVKGATVIEQGHDEYGNIFVNVDNASDGKDMASTIGHEVYETYTLQTGGVNDATQEVIADMVGNQLANRLDGALGGTLGNTGTTGLAGSATVQYGNTRADNVGNAQVDYRYLTPSERELAVRLAKESGGLFTEQEMLDALRHTLNLPEGESYPEGMNSHVLDTAIATQEALAFMDASEGRLIVTPGEDGNARYLVQDMSAIPLNDDAKEYIKQQDLGYSFIEQVERVEDSYREPFWDYRGAGSLAMATGLSFNLDTVDTRTTSQIEHDMDKFTLGMASLIGAPISGGASLYALGGRGTLGLLSTAVAFDVAGQSVQEGEYRPGQTVLAAQTALTFGPLLSTSWRLNTALGATAGGGNVAANNFYYDENKSWEQGAFWGAVGAGSGTYLGNYISNTMKNVTPQISVPFFQTPATVTVTLPAATTVGKNVETVFHNMPAFIPLSEVVHADKNQSGDKE
ncbi:hemagglutinin repeat-containing protein [Alkalimonas sp. NCh-2]|uniref:hemagglutinin repeat-containing protein n=1 Tax=Alkalimonas sp. NCh-2 TaxID=3144846 RepID=UPI0031F62138